MLWRIKVGTIRDVYDELVSERDVAQPSVATMMQIMHKKRLLKVVDHRRPAKYAPAADSAAMKRDILNGITRQLFAGSAKSLIMHLLQSRKQSDEKRARVEKLLDELE